MGGFDGKTEALIKINELIEEIDDETDESYDHILKKMPFLVRNDKASHIKVTEYPETLISLHKILTKYLCDNDESLKKFLVDDTYNKTYYNDIPEIVELRQYVIRPGIYPVTLKFKKKKHYILYMITETRTDDDYISTTEIYIIGKYHDKLAEFIKKERQRYKDILDRYNTTYINTYKNGGADMESKETPFKSFDNMIIKDKDKLIKYIDRWVESIPIWYKYNMIPKLSILVYGPPGTGKSTLCRAVANHLNISNVGIISADFFNNTEGGGSSRRPNRLNSPYNDEVIALDDLDCFVNSRETDTSIENGKLMNKILEFLDNPPNFYYEAKDGVRYLVSIVIATTNYYDKLDPAIKRHGRFDLQFEMGMLDYEETREFCKYYNLDISEIFPDVKDTKKFKVSPAEVQAKCMAAVEIDLKKDIGEK